MGRHPLLARSGRYADHALRSGAARKPVPRGGGLGRLDRQPVPIPAARRGRFGRLHPYRGPAGHRASGTGRRSARALGEEAAAGLDRAGRPRAAAALGSERIRASGRGR